jgi:XTP/dITP diphosphohydrolase
MSRTLVLATGNPGKAREVKALLPAVEVLTLADRPVEMPEETGETFEANARLKAEHAADVLGVPALADDSGLEVDALGGRPGVHSARYAPGTDEDRYRKLLDELEGEPARSARFVCVMALAAPGRETVLSRGTCEGTIALEPFGDGGFGYDPVFVVGGEDRTMANLTPEEKNERSHRGAALRAMAPHLEALFAPRGP